MKWSAHIPGNLLNYSPFYGANEEEARAAVRCWLGVRRLPNGVTVEPYDEETLLTTPEQMELFRTR